MLTVIRVPPVIVVLIPWRQRPSLLRCPLGRLLVGFIQPQDLPSAGIRRELGPLGGLERLDRIMRRDMRRIIGRTEAGGAGAVERICELLARGDVEEFANLGALGVTYG